MVEHVTLFFFFRALVGGILLGALISASIRANIKSQNHYQLDPSFYNNCMQTVSYLAILGSAVISAVVLFIHLIDTQDAASTITLCVSALVVVVVAFHYQWIPELSGDSG